MRGFIRLIIQEAKLFLRDPLMAFFSLVLPPAIMLFFGFLFGNAPNPQFGGLGTVDASVPAYVGMVIGLTAFMSLPITLSNYRERGILRRYRATPMRPMAVLGAQIVIQFMVTAVGVLLLALLGKAVFQMRFSGSLPATALGFTISCLSFFALGMVIASLAPSAKATVVIGNIVLYPMIYLSGATVPLEVLPSGMRAAAKFILMTHIVTLMRGLWIGDPLSAHAIEFVVLGAVMAVSLAIAAFTFRWE